MSKLSLIPASSASVHAAASPIDVSTYWVCGDGFAGAMVLTSQNKANQYQDLQNFGSS
jgi:hypothetical protein